MRATRSTAKIAAGFLLGAAAALLAVRGVDFGEVAAALAGADPYWIGAAAALMMFSHYLRARRWRFFLAPIAAAKTGGLFSALMIGYAANTFVPAHLGELLRAAVAAKKLAIPASAAMATIVVERIIDVIALIAVMGLVVLIHPFPPWVVTSGVLMLSGAAALLAIICGLKRFRPHAHRLVRRLTAPLPGGLARRVEAAAAGFLDGATPLASAGQYAAVLVLSAAIWLCYAGVYYACLLAFDLVAGYGLAWSVGLVVLVFTTVSVVIPSTPGYVGTFHYLCQMSLVMFGVPAAAALSFAVVAHAVGVLPVTAAGLVCANLEGIALFRGASTPPADPPPALDERRPGP
jgi:hypothetical protein